MVGWAETKTGERHAFVWEHGEMTDLGTLGKNARAVAINERNQIVGWSVMTSGQRHAVLWT